MKSTGSLHLLALQILTVGIPRLQESVEDVLLISKVRNVPRANELASAIAQGILRTLLL